MDKEEKVREKQFLILIVISFMILLLTAETILMKWDIGAIVLLVLGLAICWWFHILDKADVSIREWMYLILSLLACFFYGIHETSMYDLAPLMLLIIVLFATLEKIILIKLCVATYFVIMGYDFIILHNSIEFSSLFISRTMIHFVFVFLVGYLSEFVIKQQQKEKKNTEKVIQNLEEINLRTEDFLTNVSHELRTPINAVTGISSIMLKNEYDAEKVKNLRSIQKAGNRLFEQIEDILDYTEIDTGRIRVSHENYMITSIVNDVIIENQMLERESQLELVFDVDAKIPSMLIGDGKKIKKILRHLIDNAYKFTKKGGIYVRIYALHKDYGMNLCIRVSDTGVGLSEDEVEKISERFYQANGGRNRKAGGLGLGLSIVYGLVSAMGGFIHIESEKDKGTTVCVSIPQSIADAMPCMVINNKKNLCVGCFLKPEKYRIPQIRKYYDEMISNIVQGMDITIHRLYKLSELEKLDAIYQLTHLFIGREEYEENEAYFDKLSENMEIIISADADFTLNKDSKIRILRKPFYCLPVTNILNSEKADEESRIVEKHMICPDTSVLVVDDEPMNLMVAEGIFKDYQMEISTADSGIKAIELCETETYDLIFLDHMMPEMDGVETLKRLRNIASDTNREFTIIAFTANAVSGAKEMFLQAGFDEFISKPIELNELERVLRKVLPQKAIRYENKTTKREFVTDDVSGKENLTIPVKSETPDDPDDIIARLHNNGLNTKNGMQYSQDDFDFYTKLLNEFAVSHPAKKAELEDCFEKEDIKKYRIYVHALKSTSRLIGADTLSEMAFQAESAADNDDIKYIRQHHKEIMSKYDETVNVIVQIMGTDHGESEEDLSDITKESLLEQCQNLKGLLEAFEIDAVESLISDMCKFKYGEKSVENLISEIKNAFEEFDYTVAVQRTIELIENLERGDM